MIDNAALQLTLTGVFACAAAYYFVPAVAANPAAERVDAAWHVLAGIAMVVMLWPWGMAVPPMAGAAVFACAAVWFAGQATVGGGSRLSHWYHAVMMTSMVAMWVVMAHRTPGAAAAHPDSAMASMAMAASDMPHHHAPATSPSWVAPAMLAVGAVYLLVAGVFTFAVWRTRGARRCGASALMAAGMGATFLAAV